MTTSHRRCYRFSLKAQFQVVRKSKWDLRSNVPKMYLVEITCARMLYFLVIPLWPVAERFEAGVGASSDRDGLMEFAFGRVSDPWDVPVFSVATRNITTQHLFQVKTSILRGINIRIPRIIIKKKIKPLENLVLRKWRFLMRSVRPVSVHAPRSPDYNRDRAVMKPRFCSWKSDNQKNDCHRLIHLKNTESPVWRETMKKRVC